MTAEDLAQPPTPGFRPLGVFEALLPRFNTLRTTAEAYASPNPEDDLPVRLAIVGFSFNAPTDSWAYEHFCFVAAYRDRELNAEALAWHEDVADLCLQFSCLAIGYVLGLRQAEKINDTDLLLAESLLPSFLIQHSGSLQSLINGAI